MVTHHTIQDPGEGHSHAKAIASPILLKISTSYVTDSYLMITEINEMQGCKTVGGCGSNDLALLPLLSTKGTHEFDYSS